jgi:hypothetical protein
MYNSDPWLIEHNFGVNNGRDILILWLHLKLRENVIGEILSLIKHKINSVNHIVYIHSCVLSPQFGPWHSSFTLGAETCSKASFLNHKYNYQIGYNIFFSCVDGFNFGVQFVPKSINEVCAMFPALMIVNVMPTCGT